VELLPPDIDTALRIDTTKAGFTPAFLFGAEAGGGGWEMSARGWLGCFWQVRK